MTERLFFALWPGAEQRAALAQVQGDLVRRDARKTHPDDLHITLVFLGDVAPEGRACAEAAGERVGGRAFELALDRIGCYPRARVLWCGPSAPPSALLELVGALERELRGCGFSPERRPYAPHTTLARKARPLAARPLVAPISWLVAEFVLVIAGDGPPPRYRVLRRWPLA